MTPRAVAGRGRGAGPRGAVGLGLPGRDARPLEQVGGPVAAVGFANQGETVLAWDRGTGRPLSTAISWQDRRAAGICADMAQRGRVAHPCDRASARPLLRGAQDDLAATQRDRRRRGHYQRHLAPAPPHGRLRHRRHDRFEDAAARPRTAYLVGGGLRRLRPRRDRSPRGRRLRDRDRPHRRVRAVAPGVRTQRGPAGGIGRAALPGARRVQVHLRHGGVLVGQRGTATRSPPPPAWPSRWPGSTARVPPTASTARSMPPGPPSPGSSAGGSSAAPRTSTRWRARWTTAEASPWSPPSPAWEPRGGDPTPWPRSRGSVPPPNRPMWCGPPSTGWRRR